MITAIDIMLVFLIHFSIVNIFTKYLILAYAVITFVRINSIIIFYIVEHAQFSSLTKTLSQLTCLLILLLNLPLLITQLAA